MKKGEMGCASSSTSAGSDAPANPDMLAGPSRRTVAYVSCANSGNDATTIGFKPEAFQDVFMSLLKTPMGAFKANVASLLP